ARGQRAAPVGVGACDLHLHVADGGEAVADDHLDTGFEDSGLDEVLLLAGLGPGRHRARWRHDRDREAAPAQFLRDHTTHVAVVVVEDDDRAGNRCAGEDVLGREDVGVAAAGDGLRMGAADTVLAPAGAGGEDDAGRVELLYIGGGETAVAVDGDVGHALDLPDAVVAHADPLV